MPKRLSEAIFKGRDGEPAIGPARLYLKPYWKQRGVSYFHEEGGCGSQKSLINLANP